MAASFRMRHKEGPIKATFGESIRHLAKSYYPFIYSDSRNISKPVVDLQAAFEICYESLDEYERISSEMSSLTYSIYGIEQALYRALNELSVIREEVADLLNALRTSEKFNLRLLDQLSMIDENIQSGIDSGRTALGNSRMTSAPLSLSAEQYMIPRATREVLENIADQGTPASYSLGMSDNVLRERINPDMARLHWLTQIQRDLGNRHAELSFLVICLWSEQVRDNFHLANRRNGCGPSGPKTSYDKPKRHEEESMLRMASSAKIEELPSVVQNIQGRVFELGGLIVDELNRLRMTYEDTRMQHRNLTSELSERRRQLIDSLLATHSAVQTLLDLDEKNDALVGKLVKTRPLFADLYRIVQSETLTEDVRNSMPMQTLADVLGPQSWRTLVDQLGKLRVTGQEDATEPD